MRAMPLFPEPYRPAPGPPPDDAFASWLTGFIDGEASFTIGHDKAGPYSCRFALSVRADDMAIVEEICARLQLGRLHYIFTPSLRAKPNGNPSVEWLITKKSECVELVEFLDRYPLRSKKADDFAIWREAVYDWATTVNAAGGKGRDWTSMRILKEQIEAGRKFRWEQVAA